ncbi:putative triacylglycerol lipase [Helianthus annuus]|nr:putative triacylglycerol lipase [Helianthus annuus]
MVHYTTANSTIPIFRITNTQCHRNEPSAARICASAVTKYGYKCQEIDVTTEDGYILSVQRIPVGRTRWWWWWWWRRRWEEKTTGFVATWSSCGNFFYN